MSQIPNFNNSDSNSDSELQKKSPQEPLADNKPTLKSDPELDAAVDDIVREESNQALQWDDQLNKADDPGPRGLKKVFQKVRSAIIWWWQFTMLRNISLGVLFLLLITLALIPTTRYSILNSVGVRVSSSLTVIDNQTLLPLKNITVELQDQQQKTDQNGTVYLKDLRLGKSNLKIHRRGYADLQEQIILGWGSNPLGQKSIRATGFQYSFELHDWISNAPITSADAISGDYSAQADPNGKIILTLDGQSPEDAEITIYAAGYRDQTFDVNKLSTNKPKNVLMVNDRRHLFVSNRNSKFDLFSADLDGKNDTLYWSASGKERSAPEIYPHPQKQLYAVITSREGQKNSDGYTLESLFVVDGKDSVDDQTSSPLKIARSEQIHLVGWSGDFLVYWLITEGTSSGNQERSKLFSYNLQTNRRIQLASANYFNDAKLIGSTVYYAVSAFAVPQSYAQLFQIEVEGNQKLRVLDKNVYRIFRTAYQTLLYNTENRQWFEQKLPDQPQKTDNYRSTPEDIKYLDSPSSQRFAWVQKLDGQNILKYAQQPEVSKSYKILNATGIHRPLYWVGDEAIVYRVITPTETADYLVSLQDRPESKSKVNKISNVTVSGSNYYNP